MRLFHTNKIIMHDHDALSLRSRTFLGSLFAALMMGSLIWLSGCSLSPSNDLESTSQLRQLVIENQARWERMDIDDYRIVYDRIVGDNADQDVLVIVRNGTVDSVSQAGESIGDDVEVLTIDAIFSEMLEVLSRDDRGPFNVRFEGSLSYPMEYRVRSGDDTPGQAMNVFGFEDERESSE